MLDHTVYSIRSHWAGSVTSKENLMVNKKIAKEIYPVLNGQGALYIDAANFQPEYLSSPTPYMFPSVQVNPNYLKNIPCWTAVDSL